MHKISLEISFNILELLCSIHDLVSAEIKNNPSRFHCSKEFKVANNVINLLFISLKKKYIANYDCKSFNLKLEYYQAYYLGKFISANNGKHLGCYEYYLLLHLLSKIEQEL
ncbi:hypothetical protein [Tenacibaculum maritimum]|uniref:hypothetical protein n=1 Tax=Tenacibaculum maritimum TaxID=107401 RepID=UPI0012E4A176|nr:hypothetical protein [Tenacibaculum maritimum]CAA0159253.1 hypothetical protein FS0810_100119 [Tenacibaculum maritimum]